jgi:hypothetical protein
VVASRLRQSQLDCAEGNPEALGDELEVAFAVGHMALQVLVGQASEQPEVRVAPEMVIDGAPRDAERLGGASGLLVARPCGL